MSCYRIVGGRPLEGRLTVQGAKNSVLPILVGDAAGAWSERD